MKKVYILLSFFIFISSNGFGQKPLNLRGTMIMASIASDGIMVAADSRALEKDGNLPLRYFDSTSKLIKLNNFIVGVTGVATIDGISIFTIIKRFNNAIKYDGDPAHFVVQFYSYLKANYSKELIGSLVGNRFFMIGYFQAEPRIIVFKIQDIMEESLPTYSDYSTAGEQAKANFDKKLSCTEMGKRAEDAINQFSKKYYFLYSIGGPVSIVQVHPDNSITWLQNKFEDKMETNKFTYVNVTKEQQMESDSLRKLIPKP